MRKILTGLIAFALLIAMTGVVSATDDNYCKATGGGTLNGEITVGFNAQGNFESDGSAKGHVNIIYHDEDKTRLNLDVKQLYLCGWGTHVDILGFILEDGTMLCVYDYGEGSNAYQPDVVEYYNEPDDFFSGIPPIFGGELSGNVQVTQSIFPIN